MLLKAGADVNAQESDYENTPAHDHWAAQSGNVHCLELLHCAGALWILRVILLLRQLVLQMRWKQQRVEALNTKPLSLKSLCRLAVRQHLVNCGVICRLTIPAELKDFLEFREALDCD